MTQDQGSREFQAPNLSHYRPTSSADLTLVRSLSKRLAQQGLLARDESPITVTESADAIFQEAAANAKSEKELNSAYYEPEVEALVAEREAREGDVFANPQLDGRDDYDQQVYATGSPLSEAQRQSLLAEEEDDALEKVMNGEKLVSS